MTQYSERLETANKLIEGIALWIDRVREVFIGYFISGEMSFDNVKSLIESKKIMDNVEEMCFTIFINMKHGGDDSVITHLKDAITRFDSYFDKVYEDGYDYDKFDFVVITDLLILNELKKLNEYVEKRIAKIKKWGSWLEEQIPVIDMANIEEQDIDEAVDVEKEYKFKFDNVFDDMTEISARSRNFMDLRKIHDDAQYFSIYQIFDFIQLIKSRVERYEDSKTPVEHVMEKYEKAKAEGAMILHEEYKLYDWEIADISESVAKKLNDTAIKCDDELKDSGQSPTTSVSNSALFNREYFSMTHVQHLHGACNGRQFEEFSPGDMNLIVNLQHCPRNMKVRDRERSRVCYLIYFLGEMLPDNKRSGWRKAMLDSLEIPYSYYNKKYLNPTGGDSSKK